MGVGCGPAFKRPPPIYFSGSIHRPETVIFLETGLFRHRAPEQAQTRPATGPGYRPHLCRTKRPQDCPQTPGGWVSARRDALGAKRAHGLYRAIGNQKNNSNGVGGDLLTVKHLNLSLCTHWLQCDAKLYRYRGLTMVRRSLRALSQLAQSRGLARL